MLKCYANIFRCMVLISCALVAADQSDGCACRWAVPLTINYSCAKQGYDCFSRKVPLSQSLFGGSFTFSDIFLFSRLCEQGNVHIINMPNPPKGNRVDYVNQPNLPFGAYKDDLYPALLASTKVDISTSFKEITSVLSIIRRKFALSCGVTGILGISIPVVYKAYDMDVHFWGGKLFRQVFAQEDTVRETSVYQFFKDYEDIYDFFKREIADKKNLIFDQHQSKLGFGDITFFAVADLAYLSDILDAWNVGLNFIVPSGGKYKGDKVLELVLGNGGAFQGELFTNVIFTTPMWFVNPCVRLSCQVSAPFKAKFRIPLKVSNAAVTQVIAVPDLIAPYTFDNYWVESFTEVDSVVPWFADSAVKTRIRWGSRFLCGIGNYAYNLLYDNFRLGLFYDFAYKASDKYRVDGSPVNAERYYTKRLSELTNEHMHRIGWNLTYSFATCGELMCGSQHVLSGKNIPKTNDFFVALTAVF